MVKIALVDDHTLLRRGLADLVRNLGYEVTIEADNGKQFIETLTKSKTPDIVLLDINMPEMNGFQTAAWLKQHHPLIKILALSMYDNETSIISMVRLGVRGYILKDSEPEMLGRAIENVLSKGFHHSELITQKLATWVAETGAPPTKDGSPGKNPLLTNKELEFLKLACTELTYKEIANKLHISIRTVDGYRDILFGKLRVKSRIGMVLYGVRHGLTNV